MENSHYHVIDESELVDHPEAADWMDSSIGRRGKVFYTNCLFAKAVECMNELAAVRQDKERFGEVKIIKERINVLLWPEAKGKKFLCMECLDFFESNGYLIVDAPRTSGKTTILKEIIKRNPDKRILVLSKYPRIFEKFKNCTVKDLDDYSLEILLTLENYDIVLGDEFFVKPREGVKTACVYTSKYIIKRLTVEDSLRSVYSIAQDREFNGPLYEVELGQYRTIY